MGYKLFIDESGDHSLDSINEDFPIFALLGIVIDDNNYKGLEESVNKFKIKYFKTTDIVLHSRDIRKCEAGKREFSDTVLKYFPKKTKSLLAKTFCRSGTPRSS